MRSSIAGCRLFLLVSLAVAANGALPTTVRAETRTAAALTPEAVWEAINAAEDGDSVRLPEWTAVWKSGWNAGHWAKMKAITIQGAGIDRTIIRTDTTRAPGEKAFVINGVEGKPFRITGITFDGTGFPDAGTWAGEVVIGGHCKNFRVDHCKFLNMDQMMTITGDTHGLVDHCQFHALQKKGGLAQTIYCQGPGKVAFTRPSPCYAWNNTFNGAKLEMTLRRWDDPEWAARQAAHVKEGRDFFNEAPKPELYKPYTYPHPLQNAR